MPTQPTIALPASLQEGAPELADFCSMLIEAGFVDQAALEREVALWSDPPRPQRPVRLGRFDRP